MERNQYVSEMMKELNAYKIAADVLMFNTSPGREMLQSTGAWTYRDFCRAVLFKKFEDYTAGTKPQDS